MQTNHQQQSGFTLIEVLVVAPLVILLIGITIGYISTLTGDGLKTQQRNTLAYNTQDALDTIDQDISYTLAFKTTTGVLPAPQGTPDGTASPTGAFTNNSGSTLILELGATDKNTLDPSRQLISLGTGACDADKPLYTYYSVYFVYQNILYKRIVIQSQSACAVPYQVNSCSPSTMQQATPPANCKAEDEALVDNVQNFSIAYKTGSSNTTPTNAAVADNLIITLASAKTVAGDNLTYSGILRSTRVNE